MSKKVTDLDAEAYAYYMTHPVEFVETQIMGMTPDDIIADKPGFRLEPASKSIMYNVGKYDYVSVFGGRGISKTFSLACLVIWWIATRNDARVMCTGPKFDQLKATLWAEVNKWLQKSYWSDQIKWSSESIQHVDERVQSFGGVMTSKQKENIAGIHATHVMWIVDEASNVEQDILDAILGGMNDPENKIIMCGNPTKASGAFFDSQNKDRDQWKCLRFSSEDSARVNKVWLKKMQRFPRDSDMYRVYVLGLPPQGNPKAILSLADCHAARDRDVGNSGALEMGIDPAREGNDLTAIAIGQGNKLLEVRTFPKTKGPEVRAHALKMLREYRAKTGYKGVVRVKIDDHGIGGPIADEMALNETDNIDVVPCLFGGKGDDKYADSATVMWFGLAEDINEIELPNDEELLEELSTREWLPASGGRMKVESKPDYKKRLGRSPDRSDAAILWRAKGPKKVFIRGEENAARKFEVDWQNSRLMDESFDGVLMVEVLHYSALVLGNDLSFCGLAAVYQQYLDQLWIYDEFYQDRPEPDLIARVVRSRTKIGLYSDDREVRVIGNERMFRGEGDRRPLSDVFRQEGLVVQEPVRYDEYGAIALGARMFGEGRVTMHECLEKSRVDIGLWSVKKGKPDVDESGFVKALLLILSEVRRQKKTKIEKSGMPDYSAVRRPMVESKGSLTRWCRR